MDGRPDAAARAWITHCCGRTIHDGGMRSVTPAPPGLGAWCRLVLAALALRTRVGRLVRPVGGLGRPGAKLNWLRGLLGGAGWAAARSRSDATPRASLLAVTPRTQRRRSPHPRDSTHSRRCVRNDASRRLLSSMNLTIVSVRGVKPPPVGRLMSPGVGARAGRGREESGTKKGRDGVDHGPQPP